MLDRLVKCLPFSYLNLRLFTERAKRMVKKTFALSFLMTFLAAPMTECFSGAFLFMVDTFETSDFPFSFLASSFFLAKDSNFSTVSFLEG